MSIVHVLVAITWISLAILITAYNAIKIAKRDIWVEFRRDGIVDSEGSFFAWEMIKEIKYILGVLCIRMEPRNVPDIALNPKVLGVDQVRAAENFLRAHAPNTLLKRL